MPIERIKLFPTIGTPHLVLKKKNYPIYCIITSHLDLKKNNNPKYYIMYNDIVQCIKGIFFYLDGESLYSQHRKCSGILTDQTFNNLFNT